MKKLKPIVATAFIVPFLFGCNKTQTVEKFTLTVVNGVGGGTYTKDEQITIVATVPANKTFKEWQVDSTKVSTENPYKVTVTKDVTYTAIFEDAPAETATITVENGFGSGSYKKGEKVTIVADIPEGKAFKEWKSGATTVSSENPYQVTVAENVTYTATFEDAPQGEIKITTIDNFPGEGGSKTQIIYSNKGERIDVPVPEHHDNYVLENWYTDSTCTQAFDFEEKVHGDVILYGKWIEASEAGLEFTADDEDDPTCYTVAWDGSEDLPDAVAIPSTHKGKPVVGITPEKDSVYAFDDSNIKSVSVPSTFTEIGDYGFCGAKKLRMISLPNTITKLGYESFCNCYDLSGINLNEGITEIGYCCFNLADLKDVKLPKSLAKLDEEAFEWNPSLRKVDMSKCNKLKAISRDCFCYCYGLKEVIWPEECSIEIIDEESFYECTALNNITIPNTVITIGDCAFYECYALKYVNFESNSRLETINEDAFCYCYSLLNVEIPASVQTIGKEAFYECYSLRTVTYEENSNLEKIGASAFLYCYVLKDIFIPKYVNSIGERAFYGCTKQLSNVIFENIDDTYTVVNNETTISEYKPNVPGSNPDPLTLLKNGATFKMNGKVDEKTKLIYLQTKVGCSISGVSDKTLTKITIPLTVKDGNNEYPVVRVMEKGTYINDNTYLNGVTEIEFEINSDGVNPNLKYIDDEGFDYFVNATKITNLGKCTNLNYIGEYAFYKFGYNYSSSGTHELELDLSSCLNLTKLKIGVFEYCYPLKSIILPSSLTHIEDYCFEYDSYLENVDLSKCTNLIEIGETDGSVFYSCLRLESIDLSKTKISYLRTSTFCGCYLDENTGLKSIILPETLISIGSYCFCECKLLNDVAFPSEFAISGYKAWDGCDALTTITFDNSEYAHLSYTDTLGSGLFNKVATVYLKNGTKMTEEFKKAFTKSETSEKEGYEKWNKNAE